MRDQISNIQLIRGAPQTLSGTTPNSSALIDRRGFSAVSLFVETGTVTDAGTAAGFTAVVEESDSTAAASFTAVAATDLVKNSGGATSVTVTADADDDKIINGVGYVGMKRYVRLTFTGTTGTAAVVNMLAVLGKPQFAPTTTVGATTAAT